MNVMRRLAGEVIYYDLNLEKASTPSLGFPCLLFAKFHLNLYLAELKN